jgi:UrcA family protein
MFHKPNRFHVLTLSLGSLLTLAALGWGGTAQAIEAKAAQPSVTVSYRDLDLARVGDVHTLYRRLQQAASDVCMPTPPKELSRYMQWQRCYRTALDSAVLEVRSPELLALYRASGSSGA